MNFVDENDNDANSTRTRRNVMNPYKRKLNQKSDVVSSLLNNGGNSDIGNDKCTNDAKNLQEHQQSCVSVNLAKKEAMHLEDFGSESANQDVHKKVTTCTFSLKSSNLFDIYDAGIDWGSIDDVLETNEKSVTNARMTTKTDGQIDTSHPSLSTEIKKEKNPRLSSQARTNVQSKFIEEKEHLISLSSLKEEKQNLLNSRQPSSSSVSSSCPLSTGKVISNSAFNERKKQKKSKMSGIKLELPESWQDSPFQNVALLNKDNNNDRSEACKVENILPKSKFDLPEDLKYNAKHVAAVEDGKRADLIKAADISGKLLNGWRLLNHQKQAVIKAIRMRRMVLAFDMGLGKTLIACVWAKAFKGVFSKLKVFVIAPVSLQKSWEKCALEATGLRTSIQTKDEFDMDIQSWGKIPDVPSKSVKYFIVICDEAHYLQNISSKRTKDTLKLVLDKRCAGVLLLTGTPMKNGKPSNIFPLLKAVRHPFGNKQRTFEAYFCAGQQKNFGRGSIWDASGSSNLPTLSHHISSQVFYMTKEECLKDLPPKTRKFVDVPVSSRSELKHQTALLDLANTYEGSKRNHESSGEAILGAFQRIRIVAAFAKVDATVALALKTLETESSIVIFSVFVEVCRSINEKIRSSGWECEVLTGQTKPSHRQESVDRFQDGISSVFICTFGAGGVGLTLTAASTIILNDRPWTPGDALQAEDRVRRIGQTKPVTSIWLRSFEIDKKIDSLIEQKEFISKCVMTGNKYGDDSSRSCTNPKISVVGLLLDFLSPSLLNAQKQNS